MNDDFLTLYMCKYLPQVIYDKKLSQLVHFEMDVHFKTDDNQSDDISAQNKSIIIREFISALSRLKLKHLNLRSYSEEQRPENSLILHRHLIYSIKMGHFGGLAEINLSNLNLGDKLFFELVAAWIARGRNFNLKKIDLSHNNGSEHGIKHLGKLFNFGFVPNLSYLKIKSNNAQAEGIEELKIAILNDKTPLLTYLDISYNSIDEYALAEMVDALAIKLPHLTELHIEDDVTFPLQTYIPLFHSLAKNFISNHFSNLKCLSINGTKYINEYLLNVINEYNINNNVTICFQNLEKFELENFSFNDDVSLETFFELIEAGTFPRLVESFSNLKILNEKNTYHLLELIEGGMFKHLNTLQIFTTSKRIFEKLFQILELDKLAYFKSISIIFGEGSKEDIITLFKIFRKKTLKNSAHLFLLDVPIEIVPKLKEFEEKDDSLSSRKGIIIPATFTDLTNISF